MAKDNKAYINLKTPGAYEYLTTLAFENSRSESLRLKEVRLYKAKEQKTFKLPLTLLTWFTKHAPAGREITREENNHEAKAGLYVDLSILREQIETFSLKEHCFLEIDFLELTRSDEALERKDQGQVNIKVQLYAGPKTICHLEETPHPATNQPLLFPKNIGRHGRFDLAETVLRANEGPVDPRSDKRLIIANIKLASPYEELRHPLIERLRLFKNQTAMAQTYVRDSHQYEERFKTHPFDQKISFPDGVQAFGPLMPLGPKEKAIPLTLSLQAPITDSFWDHVSYCQQQNDGTPITGELELILPDPEANFSQPIKFTLSMDKEPCLIVQDAAAQEQPVLISFTDRKAAQEETLILPQALERVGESDLIALIHYQWQTPKTEQAEPFTVTLTPENKQSAAFAIKPDIVDITHQKHHLLLLNPTPGSKKQTKKSQKLRLTCSWPDSERQLQVNLTINKTLPLTSQIFAIDIGSKAIAMAKTQIELNKTKEDNRQTVKQVPLATKAPDQYLTNECVPATCLISTMHNPEDEEQTLIDQNWRAQTYPLSVGYHIAQTPLQSAEQRLKHSGQTYDVILPSHRLNANKTGGTTQQPLSLKSLFNGQTAKQTLGKDDYYIEAKTNQSIENTVNLGLTKQLQPIEVIADSLNELLGFYGTYLERLATGPDLTVEARNAAITLKDPSQLVLTLPDYASAISREAVHQAGAKALSNYECGSFKTLGAAADFLGLPSPESAQPNVHIISETAAGAYAALSDYAQQSQPGRAKRMALIHYDIGHHAVNISTFSGWIGETKALLDCQHSIINLPMGGKTLDLMLALEISKILETAMNAGAPVHLEAPLPLSWQAINTATAPKNNEQKIQQTFLTELQQTLHEASTHEGPKKNDLKLCLAKSTDGHWPLSLSATLSLDAGAITLWQGLREEKLILQVSEDKKEWRLELHASSALICEKVGALSTYISFLTQFLPRILINSLPNHREPTEHLISLSGGTSLYKPLQQSLAASGKTLGYHLIPPKADYKAVKQAVPQGAIRLIAAQGKAPERLFKPNLILLPLTGSAPHQDNIALIKETKQALFITAHKASGPFPEGCSNLHLIETIPGLGQLMQQDLNALDCKTYLDDLDRANKAEWAFAENLWQNWLQNCTQTILNMAAPTLEEGQGNPATWHYQSLQENEAELTIAGHRYWVSSGLTTQDH